MVVYIPVLTVVQQASRRLTAGDNDTIIFAQDRGQILMTRSLTFVWMCVCVCVCVCMCVSVIDSTPWSEQHMPLQAESSQFQGLRTTRHLYGQI